jgi:hypothetical protein
MFNFDANCALLSGARKRAVLRVGRVFSSLRRRRRTPRPVRRAGKIAP